MNSILHLTTVHPRFDIRIFIKEVQTLACQPAYKVFLLVADGEGNVGEGYGGLSIHDLGCLGRGRFRRMLLGPLRAFFAIRKIKPDIVHFHDPELIPLGVFLRVIGYKVIYDVHEDAPRQTLSKYWLPWIIRRPMSWAMSSVEWCGAYAFNAIVAATPKIAARFPCVKTVRIQNFPILSEMLPLAPIRYVERPQSFVYAGIIATTRGAVEMVRAFEFLRDIPNARLDLAGTSSPNGLGDKLRGLTGGTSVNYHGQVSREQVRHLFGSARAGLVLFHPLPNHMDAQPNKMFEYMSAGLPVIASDFPLWRQIIDGAGCGLLADPLNPKSIAEAMRWILDHPAEAEAMGRRGRQAVEHTYNWDTEATKIIRLYNELLAS